MHNAFKNILDKINIFTLMIWVKKMIKNWFKYTALQKFGNSLENGVLDHIGMHPF